MFHHVIVIGRKISMYKLTFTIMPLMYMFVFFCYILSNWAAEVPFYPSFCRNFQNVKQVNIDIPVCQNWLLLNTANHLSPHRLFSTFKIPTDPNFNIFYPTVLITEEYTLQQVSFWALTVTTTFVCTEP